MLVLVLACITPDAEYERMRRRVMDSDLDGYVVEDYRQRFEDEPEDWMLGMDCDDEDADIHPGMDEVAYNEIDDDCDPDTFDDDADGDGFRLSDEIPDCDDDDPAVNPGAEEVCDNGIDDDCDGGPGPCTWEGVKSLDDAVEVEGFCESGLCSPGIVADLGLDGVDEWIPIDGGEGDDSWSVPVGRYAGGAFETDIVALEGTGSPAIDVAFDGSRVGIMVFEDGVLESMMVGLAGGSYDLAAAATIDPVHEDSADRAWLLKGGGDIEIAVLFSDEDLIATDELAYAGQLGVSSARQSVQLGGTDDVRSVVRADTNGSGIAEIVVGHGGSADLGVVAVLDDVGLRTVADPEFALTGEVTGDQFGQQLLADDLNGDGYADLVIAALAAEGGAPDGGFVTVYNGGQDGPSQALRIVGDESNELWPFLEVLDDEERSWIVIGAPFYGGTGEVLLVDAGSEGTIGFADVEDRIDSGTQPGAVYLPMAGDVNNDGQEDIVISKIDGGSLSTRFYLVAGATL